MRHSPFGCAENIDLIDDCRFNNPEGMAQGVLHDDPVKQRPFFCGKLFGIFYIWVKVMAGKNNSGSYDRSGKRTSASFINTSNKIMRFPQMSVRQRFHPYYPRVVPWSSVLLR